MPPSPMAAIISDRTKTNAHSNSDSDSDILISLSQSLANSPQLISAPLSPAKSIATEISSHRPLEHSPHSFKSGGSKTKNRKTLQNLDLLDAMSSDDNQDLNEHAVGSPSESSDDAAFSTRAMKSPRHNSGTHVQSLNGSHIRKSRRGRRAQTESVSSDGSIEITEKFARSGSVKQIAVGKLVPEGSPRGGNGITATKNVEIPNSPNPTINTVATSSTTARAERGLYVPFLPKFLRVRGTSTEIQAREGMDESQERMDEVKPGFESDVNSGNEGIVQEAQEGRLRRPRLVQHASSTLVGLKDMLRTAGPADTENNPGSSSRKLKKMLGEDLKFSKGLTSSKRAGIIGIPIAKNTNQPITSQKSNKTVPKPNGLAIWQSPVPVYVDGLRAHPIRRSSTVPIAKRKVGFWPPLDVEVKPEHRFLRQSVVTTPYPSRYQEEAVILEPKVHNKLKATLTLVITIRTASVPIVKRIVFPNEQEMANSPDTKKSVTDFDDERLFRLIKAEYKSMRGFFRNALSARQIQSLQFISFDNQSSPTNHNQPPFPSPFRVQDDMSAGPQLLALFRTPRLGRNRRQWLDWIANRPENSAAGNTAGESEESERDPCALELADGWSAWRVFSAFTAVAALSSLATLLWILLGVGSEPGKFVPAGEGNPGSATPVEIRGGGGLGFRGAAGRITGGATLGALVLILGWTGVGGWIFLSWGV